MFGHAPGGREIASRKERIGEQAVFTRNAQNSFLSRGSTASILRILAGDGLRRPVNGNIEAPFLFFEDLDHEYE